MEEANADCMQSSHTFEYKCEHKVKFFRRQDGEEKAYFTILNSYRNLFGPIEENESNGEIQECEQGERSFSFDSILKITIYLVNMISELPVIAFYLNHIVIQNLS